LDGVADHGLGEVVELERVRAETALDCVFDLMPQQAGEEGHLDGVGLVPVREGRDPVQLLELLGPQELVVGDDDAAFSAVDGVAAAEGDGASTIGSWRTGTGDQVVVGGGDEGVFEGPFPFGDDEARSVRRVRHRGRLAAGGRER